MYKRIIEVEARRGIKGKPFIKTRELRMTFDLDLNMANGLGMLKLDMYNLSNENIIELTRGNHKEASKEAAKEVQEYDEENKVFINIWAGYEDEEYDQGELPLLFSGYVQNAAARRKIPENIVHLYCASMSSYLLGLTFKPFNTAKVYPDRKYMTLEEVLTKICVDAHYNKQGLDFIPLTEAKRSEKLYAKLIKPDKVSGVIGELRRVCKEHSITVSERVAGLGFYPAINDTKDSISAVNHLVKLGGKFKAYPLEPPKMKTTPIFGVGTIEIGHVFDSGLFPGMSVDTHGLIGGKSGDTSKDRVGIAGYDALGKPLFYTDDITKYAVMRYYMILRVIHKGDNYGTAWDTTLSCVINTTGTDGDGEING